MKRHPVKSSNINSVSYDPTTRKMHVEFKGGGVYEYHDVSPEKHQALMNADSIGGHFHKYIKNTHKFTKL